MEFNCSISAHNNAQQHHSVLHCSTAVSYTGTKQDILTLYSPVVTICTAQWSLYVPPVLTFSNSTFSPHSVFLCLVWISEQTTIISLYNINWLVCITETGCVYSASRNEVLYTHNSSPFYRSLSPVISFWDAAWRTVNHTHTRHNDSTNSNFMCYLMSFIPKPTVSANELCAEYADSSTKQTGKLFVPRLLCCGFANTRGIPRKHSCKNFQAEMETCSEDVPSGFSWDPPSLC